MKWGGETSENFDQDNAVKIQTEFRDQGRTARTENQEVFRDQKMGKKGPKNRKK